MSSVPDVIHWERELGRRRTIMKTQRIEYYCLVVRLEAL